MEYLNDSKEELKRVDHLIYVSLKYTRTVDVIRSIIDRLINAADFLVDQILYTAKQEKKISELPKLPGIKCDKVKSLYKDDKKLVGYIDYYLKLRKIMRLDFIRSTEYRRHVYMGVTLNGEELRINIDLMVEYNEISKDFFEYVKEMVSDKSEESDD
ncbi:MAG: hypothetical protein U9R08_02050 [Nanoarchaeota archaeon]|nr:hypothetical protein [Nanoarchaeota archaeon]